MLPVHKLPCASAPSKLSTTELGAPVWLWGVGEPHKNRKNTKCSQQLPPASIVLTAVYHARRVCSMLDLTRVGWCESLLPPSKVQRALLKPAHGHPPGLDACVTSSSCLACI